MTITIEKESCYETVIALLRSLNHSIAEITDPYNAGMIHCQLLVCITIIEELEKTAKNN